MNVDQATGLCGGIDVPSGANAAATAASCAKFGRRPRAIRSRVEAEVEAVEPSTITRRPDGRVARAAARRRRTARRQPGRRCTGSRRRGSHARPASGRPSMYAGGSMPNSRSAVGAMSMSAGSSACRSAGCRRTRRARAADRCSGRRSTAFVLSSNTGPATMPRRAVPRHAIARVVADEQVRRVLEIRARVERRRVERLADPDLARLGVDADRCSLPMISAFSAAASAPGATMPCCSRPLHVQEHAGEAERSRRGCADQSTSRSHSAAPVAPGFSVKIAFALQPRVQVDAAAERAEAVIRDHHQHVALAEPLQDAPDQRVVVLVQIPDRVAMAGWRGAARRVPRVEVPPEHVLDAIGRVEHAHERCRRAADRAPRRTSPRARGRCRRSAAGTSFVGDAFVERPGVLGQAERRVRADALREIRRVVRRVRDRHRRLLRIEVDRRHVEREVLVHLDHQQARRCPTR